MLKFYIEVELYPGSEVYSSTADADVKDIGGSVETVLLKGSDGMIIHHMSSWVIAEMIRIIFIAFLEECPDLRSKRSRDKPLSRESFAMAGTMVATSILIHSSPLCSS